MEAVEGISAEEHRERQGRLRAAAADRGLQAVVAFSRGGGTHDRPADVLWLTGLYAAQPFVPDLAGCWRAAGHVAVVVPVDGPVTAVVESDELQTPPVADEIAVDVDLLAATGDAVADALGSHRPARVGLLGTDAMPAHWWAALEERVVHGGGAVYDVVLSSGAASGTLGPSGGPAGAARWTTRPLAAGDLLRIDTYGSVGGYLFDFARSIVVGGHATEEQADLIDALRASVAAGIEALRPGVPLAEVVARCEETLDALRHARRHGTPAHTMGGFWGHGLGLGWESPWIGPQSDEVVEAGWCLAVERRARVAGLGGAQYEDDVLVGPDGAELLTATAPP